MTRPSHTRAEPIDRGIIGVFGLLRHEQKPTIVNVLLTVTPGSRINSKQHLIAIIGPRKILIRPILSEHTSHRLHRTLKSADDKTGFFVATFIAPATYDPSPVLVFEKNSIESGTEPKLLATGSVLDLDSQRMNVKRVTLTGSPCRVHKKSVVVRFMFDTPEDVVYFRPVELVTRLGARGHIRESVGTHGYMKCVFDRTVFQHDTVAMHLYKRVHPKIYPDCTHY
jgi:pre-rRNA-processing protein TSR1